MAFKLKNLGAAFKDAKTRTILIVVALIVVVALGIGWLGLKRSEQKGPEAEASVATLPGVTSLPGSTTASREYTKIQEQENIQKAEEAAKTGGSALPTITRPTYLGPSELTQPTIGAVTSPACSPEALAKARQAGVKAEELRCKGCNAADLRGAGYTAGELVNAGFSANQLKDAGFNADELLAAGFSAAELAKAGFSVSALTAAGYNAAELSKAGIAQAQLAAAGISAIPVATIAKDCSVEALQKARSQGTSAADLRRTGCGAAAMRAAGYSATDLRAAGFSAGELRQAGYVASDLENAGYTAPHLREAGYSAESLAAGFTPADLKAAGFTDGELIRAGIPVALPQAAPPVINQIQPTGSISGGTSMNATLPAIGQETGVAALEALQRRQAEQMSQQERQDRIAQLQQTMAQQTAELFATWSPPATQQIQPVSTEPAGEKGASGTRGGASGTGSSAAAQAAQAAAQGPIIKAGTIMFAVLDTALNSDEPGPILATVVDGPYKGAKVVGSFQRENQRVILSFNTLNIQDQPQSIGINAFAIDPNTARTALASHVDNHYLLRFGSLFASSFITGLSEAISESGSTTTVTLNGITTTNPGLSTAEKGLVALGEVGKQFGNVLQPLFARSPTVTVNSGIGIGLLFMSDVSLNNPSPQQAVAGTVPPPPLNAPTSATLPASGFTSSTSSSTSYVPPGGLTLPAIASGATAAGTPSIEEPVTGPPGLPSLMRRSQ